jgi:site-specific recombinase XerD
MKKKKQTVTIRERQLKSGDKSLYLDIYYNGQRRREFLKLYVTNRPKTPAEREGNRQIRALAEDIRAKRELEIKHSEYGFVSPTVRKINFLDYFQKSIVEYTGKNVRRLKSCYKYFHAFIGKDYIAPKEVTENLLSKFADYLKKNLNGETPYDYFMKLKKICKQATRERIFLQNPAENISVSRDTSIKKTILNFDEIKRLYKADCSSQTVRSAFLFALNTGLRFCDLKALQWQSIDDNRLIINQEKTERRIIIDLNKNALNILKSQPRINAKVFQLLTYQTCRKHLRRWTKAAGIEKNITWHSARHSFAVNLLSNGADIKTVSGLLGHASIATTAKYLHFVDKLKKQAVNSIPEFE